MRRPVLLDSLQRPESSTGPKSLTQSRPLAKRKSVAESPPASIDIEHGVAAFKVAIKRVGTARRFTLRVRIATRDAVLTMPPRASMAAARVFAERHAEWIYTRLQRLPAKLALAPGRMVPLRGIDHRVVHDPLARSLRRVSVDAADDGAPVLRVSGRLEDAGRHLLDFLRREAQRDFAAVVDRHSRTIQKPCRRIAIRDPSSRWGSCSSKGNLNFSWRLILAPPFVLDYLAAHECAHLCHMDHSAAFWTLTERLAPRTAEAENWLRAEGSTLHRYGP